MSALEINTTRIPRVLIVEDDQDLGRLLAAFFKHEGVIASLCESVNQAKGALHKGHYDAVLVDLMLGSENGLELVPVVAREHPFTKTIVMTAFGTIDMAVGAMEQGASSFITKDTEPENLVKKVLSHIDRQHREVKSTQELERIGIVGNSPAIRELLEQINQLKDVDSTVLILGESGTGKELVARALHLLSERNTGPFEAVNCGAIPDNLLEAELFGYRKGAFTDAKEDRQGLFEICNHGTLFLDEIGDMPFALQVKLLRVLQEREIKPLGANQAYKISTRVICATHRDLDQAVRVGSFREDLFFRLSVFPIYLPSLRERPEDIPELVSAFVSKFNQQYHRQVDLPDPRLIEEIKQYPWPGNVRQLQNALERAVVMSRDGKLHPKDLFPKSKARKENLTEDSLGSEGAVAYQDAKEAFERGYLERILRLSQGNVSEAARLSGRFRSDIYRLIRKYGLDPQSYKI